jgi:hypothetical protein
LCYNFHILGQAGILHWTVAREDIFYLQVVMSVSMV